MSGFSIQKASGRADSRIEWRRLETLSPPHRNPRTHSARQIEQIAASIREFGFLNPILVDEAARRI